MRGDAAVGLVTDERSIWDGGPVTTNFGTGPGTITADGCAVEVYARLPATGEPDIIHGVLAESASVLDLGAGVGRIADPLVDLGHRVVAVDDCAEMLAHVRKAATVLCTIEDVRLPERFDAVLLASFLINTPDASQRTAFFTAARHHLATGGEVLMQWHPPEWFDSLTPGGTYHGGVATRRGDRPTTRKGSSARSRLKTSATTYCAQWSPTTWLTSAGRAAGRHTGSPSKTSNTGWRSVASGSIDFSPKTAPGSSRPHTKRRKRRRPSPQD